VASEKHMAMHQGRQSPSQSRLPRLSSAAKAARALCLPAEAMVPERQFPLRNRPDTQPNCDAHLKAKPVEIRTPCQPQNALSVFHRPSPTARSTHATENMQCNLPGGRLERGVLFLPSRRTTQHASSCPAKAQSDESGNCQWQEALHQRLHQR